ncbi:MAG: endonuclease/exonuclease/phosphatase family protein [Candidatus Aminicenantes bacterium]|nr:endonuclease/exonuclease/phosphatase family protein [Candidatus Aminicenantes bacterium]
MAVFCFASFNVENLFGRSKVFNFKDHSIGDQILTKIAEFSTLLKKAQYTSTDKDRIVQLFTEDLKSYIKVREDRGKLFKKRGWIVTGVKADGVSEWDGTIEFKTAKFSEVARKNTAKVIKNVKADVVCIVEADNRPTLRAFDSHLMNSRYKYEILIDANDPRGIDVGLYSKHPIGGVWTHMFDKIGNKTVFSRDCLEVEVFLPNDKKLIVLCNHFKSRGYDYSGTASQKRKRQAKQVAEILGKYDLTTDWIIVAGDLNDNPLSDPLNPLLTVDNMFDILKEKFPNDPDKCWTYYYNQFEQIDYILVSKPLKDRLNDAGVERRGIHKLKTLTTSSNGLVDVEKEYDSVTHWSNAASDHGAVWAKFEI